MTSKNALLHGAALATLLAVAAGGTASAKPVHHKKKSAHTEAVVVAAAPSPEVGELRSEVQQLRATVEAQAQAQAALQAQIAQQQAQVAQVVSDNQSVEARLDTVPQQVLTAVGELPKPKTDKAYYKGVSITFGGFAEAAGIYRSRDETADISSSFSKIPYNTSAAATNEFRGTARQSRYSALVEGDISADTRAYFYGEFDFQGGAQTANSNQSDSYNPRIRNLYAQLDLDNYGFSLLAGQNWSLLTMNSKGITPRNEVTPPQIDAQYIPGFAWARQPQLRLTYHTPDKAWWLAVSAENPQTTLGTIKTASGVTIVDNQGPTNGFFSGTNYSLNKYPDFIGKIAYEGALGDHTFHAEAFGIMRNFYDRTLVAATAGTQAATLGYTTGNGNQDTWGGGGGGSFSMAVVPKVLDAQVSAFAGEGIGRYGSGGLADTTSDAAGKLHGIPEFMWLAGGTWHVMPILDVYLFGGEEAETSKIYRYSAIPALVTGQGTLPGSTNATCAVEGGACSPVNKSISQVTLGFWHKIYQGNFGRVQWGLQYSYTELKAFADATATGYAPKATDNMVFASFRYYPF